MDHDSLAAVLRLPHGDEVALLEAARLDGLERAPALHHDAVHSRPGGRDPPPVDVEIRRANWTWRRTFRQHAIGRERREARRRRAPKGGLGEIRRCRGGIGHTAEETRWALVGIQAACTFHVHRGDIMRRALVLTFVPLAAAAALSAQAPPRRTPRRRDTSRVTQLPEIKVTVTRTPGAARPGAVRGRRGGRARISSGRSPPPARRGAEQHPRRRGGQPLQLLAGPADLDPRVRGTVQFRRPRREDPARRHPADAAGRAEPAQQRRVRQPRARRGAAGRQFLALRQRLRRRGLAGKRARGASAVRAARARAGRERAA